MPRSAAIHTTPLRVPSVPVVSTTIESLSIPFTGAPHASGPACIHDLIQLRALGCPMAFLVAMIAPAYKRHSRRWWGTIRWTSTRWPRESTTRDSAFSSSTLASAVALATALTLPIHKS